jgi:phosphoribosylpyrophosphate synthetase
VDAADHLVKKCGADKVYIIATHGVLSGEAIKKIEACDSVYKVILISSPNISISLFSLFFSLFSPAFTYNRSYLLTN